MPVVDFMGDLSTDGITFNARSLSGDTSTSGIGLAGIAPPKSGICSKSFQVPSPGEYLGVKTNMNVCTEIYSVRDRIWDK